MTAEKILELAKSQIGTKATDIKRCKYNTWFYGANVSGQGYDWCEVFVQWIFNQLGCSNLLGVKTANCGAQGRWFNNNGQLVKKDYKSGDVVFFHWNNDKSSWIPNVYSLDHVGIIEKVNSDGTITTIEGNTGNTNNGEVMRRVRNLSCVSCAGRPKYSASNDKYSMSKWYTTEITMERIWKTSTKNTAGQVLTAQRILKECGYKGKDGKALAIDGVFGNNTEYAVKSYQKKHGLTVDGIVGTPDWQKLLCEYKK